MDAIKTALGGVPGQIGVMVNGEYVKFPDAVPEVTGGRTMVPVRAIVEALGGGGNSATAGGRIENGDILDVRERLTQAIDAYFEK